MRNLSEYPITMQDRIEALGHLMSVYQLYGGAEPACGDMTLYVASEMKKDLIRMMTSGVLPSEAEKAE